MDSTAAVVSAVSGEGLVYHRRDTGEKKKKKKKKKKVYKEIKQNYFIQTKKQKSKIDSYYSSSRATGIQILKMEIIMGK